MRVDCSLSTRPHRREWCEPLHLQLVLRPDLYSRMVTKVAGYLGKQIENVLRRRKFNQLGGLQLDKDVRSLSALFMREAGGDPGVRQRLRRLV